MQLSITSLLAGVSLLALSVAASVAPDHVKVEISDKGYSPAKAEVTVGHKVTWTNATKSEHSVTARAKATPEQDKPLFDSGPIKAGGTFEYTFTQAGTYEYGCTMDKTMTGTVVVKAKP